MNSCKFSGRLTTEPEIKRHEVGGKKYVFAEFGLAVTRDFKKNGKPAADFPWFIAYNKQAEFIEKYIQRGRKVIVEGAFRNESYKDKEGKTQYKAYFDVQRIEPCDSRKEENDVSDTGSYVSSSMDISGLEGAEFYSENPNA